MALDIWPDDRRESVEGILALTNPFSKEEVWLAIKGVNPTSAPGPDGLTVKFF